MARAPGAGTTRWIVAFGIVSVAVALALGSSEGTATSALLVLPSPPSLSPALDGPIISPSWLAPDWSTAPTAADRPGGRLDRAVIRRIVREHYGDTSICYLWASDAELEATARVRFVIEPSGRVRGAVSLESPADEWSVASCIARRVESWRFPASERRTTVIYPFRVRTAQGET